MLPHLLILLDFTFTSLQSAVNCCFCDTFGGNIYFAGDSTPITYWYIARIFITKTQAPNLFMSIIFIGFIVKKIEDNEALCCN